MNCALCIINYLHHMKKLKSIILVIAILALDAGALNAQNIAKNDIVGSYRIAKYIQPTPDGDTPGLNYDAAIEKAKVDKALGDLKRRNPKFTSADSVQVVNDASPLYVTFCVLVCTYTADGNLTLAIGAEKPDEAQWIYDEATNHLTITDNKGRKDELQVEKRKGKIYLVQKTDDGTVTEFVKQ